MEQLRNLWNKIFGVKKEQRILFFGLDAAGKTTILYKLKLGEVVCTIPTIGFNVEEISYKNLKFTCWDVGGCDKIRPLYRHYYANTSAVVCVIDSNDRERLEEAKEEIHRALSDEELRNVVVLVLCNKQDLPNAMSPEEIAQRLDLDACCSRSGQVVNVLPCCATSGEGLHEALSWLADALSNGGAQQPSTANGGINASNNSSNEANTSNQEYTLEFTEKLSSPSDALNDDEFIAKFESFELPCWDHKTHVRLGYLYLLRNYQQAGGFEAGRRKAVEKIQNGIQQFIQHSAVSRRTTYHETMTYFWIQMIDLAIRSNSSILQPPSEAVATQRIFVKDTNESRTVPELSKNEDVRRFDSFLLANPELLEGGLFLKYYTRDTMLKNPEARTQLVLPDIKPLPSTIESLRQK